MRLSEKVAVGYAYGTSLLAYMVDGPPRPFSATFAVTNRCNLRCEYCNCPFIDPTNLALPQIDEMFSRLERMGIRRLGLAGGEPLLRADLATIIEMAKARRFFVSVNSNLTLYQRHGARLAQADLVYTSLDGDAAAHNAARGERAYEGVLEAIESLVASGKPVIAICVVTEHSIEQSAFLLEQAQRIGFRMHFQPQCVDTEIVRGSVSSTVSNEKIRRFWSELLAQKRAGRPVVSSSAYLELLSRWEDFSISAFYDADTRCPAGHGYIYIDPQGKAWACAYTKGLTKPVDLLSEDWSEAWTRDNPCTRCTVGPMLEFNLLFQKPLSALREGLRSYG